MNQTQRIRNRATLLYALSGAITLSGLVYAAVPLYRLYCRSTGFGMGDLNRNLDSKITSGTNNGFFSLLGTRIKSIFGTKSHNASSAICERLYTGPPIKITFHGRTAYGLPWQFKPEQPYLWINPGKSSLAFFTAKNPKSESNSMETTGVATYTIVPPQMAPYFNKIQCFCFEQQRLAPDEEVEMPILFYIDPEFINDRATKNVKEVILSYTFFNAQ